MAIEWISPDGKIKKVILVEGNVEAKPTENSECFIKTSDFTTEINFDKPTLHIGDNDGEFGRLLDIVLQSMNVSEVARVTFLIEEPVEFTLELQKIIPCGLIYEWNADYKYNLALQHKEKGVALFRLNKNTDASHRFSKALKIILSIPINVENPPPTINGITLVQIVQLKATLYNNLASCYLKIKNYTRVVDLCEKTIKHDSSNIKARYKIATSAYELHDYERALDSFKYVLKAEPENKAALQGVKKTLAMLNEENLKFNEIVKKMF